MAAWVIEVKGEIKLLYSTGVRAASLVVTICTIDLNQNMNTASTNIDKKIQLKPGYIIPVTLMYLNIYLVVNTEVF